MEQFIIQWLRDLIGYPGTSGGSLTTGGSMATLLAIVTARDAKLSSAIAVSKHVVYATEQTHHCISKALKIAGLKEVVIRRLPLNSLYQMDVNFLAQQIQADLEAGLLPWLMVATAGSTDLGAVDPIHEMANLAEKHDIWLHVDAAYGGFFLLTEAGKKRFHGMDRADSIVMDPHKSLFMPYGLGVIMIKKAELLYQAFHYEEAHYMQDAETLAVEEKDPAHFSIEMTKPFRGLKLWLSLQLLGVAPFRAALEEKLLLAQYFYQQLQTIKGIEVITPPQLSIVAFRYLPLNQEPNEFNAKLIQDIQQDGQVFLSSTRINGAIFIRLACLHFRTHLKMIDEVLDILKVKINNLMTHFKCC